MLCLGITNGGACIWECSVLYLLSEVFTWPISMENEMVVDYETIYVFCYISADFVCAGKKGW